MVFVFATIACFFVAAERLFPVYRQPFVRRGFFTDLLYVGIQFGMRVVINGTVAVALANLARLYAGPLTVVSLRDWPLWLQTIVLLLVLDFIFYVMHRLKHRWHWWWRLHETHHSSVDLDWLSGARFHPLEKILDRTVFLLPLTVLAPSDAAMLIWASVDAFFGMFVHSNLRSRLGPLVYIFVGPEMHRWHHANDRARRECNYGNNFSIFDWIFGTAYVSRDEPSSFGVDDADYPEHGVLQQFWYAFRRDNTTPAISADASVTASPAGTHQGR